MVDQLASISGPVPASFQYDPFGRRVSKTIGGTTQFLYDGANPVQEISGTTASPNMLTGGVDEYFQRTDSAGARNFLTDALGSTLALADSTGTIQTSYTFEPFGNTSTAGASTTNSLPIRAANSTQRAFTSTGRDTITPHSKGLSQRTQLEPREVLIYAGTQPIAPSTFETQAGWRLLIGYCRIG